MIQFNSIMNSCGAEALNVSNAALCCEDGRVTTSVLIILSSRIHIRRISETACEAIAYSAAPFVSSSQLPLSVGMPYILALGYAQTSSLHSRREEVNKQFFRDMSHHSSCIFSLLPPPRDGTITSRIRSAAIYPRPVTRTKRFTSSVQYYLLNNLFCQKICYDSIWKNNSEFHFRIQK